MPHQTQPYPVGEPFVPQDIPITPDGVKVEPGTNHVPNYGRLFTPFWTEGVIMKPGSNGGRDIAGYVSITLAKK